MWVFLAEENFVFSLIDPIVCDISTWRNNRLLATGYLSAKTLSDFKSFQSAAALDASEMEINQSSDILYKKVNNCLKLNLTRIYILAYDLVR